MKLYRYKGGMYTIDQLAKHPDCKVSEHDLRRNIWRKKLKPEVAFVTPIKKKSGKKIETYFYRGLDMTTAELMELSETTTSYWKLRILLRKGVPVELAIKGEDKVYKKEVKPQATRCKLIDSKPKGGQITFNKSIERKDKSYTYEWLVLDRFGFEMEESGGNLEKTIDKILERHYDNTVFH